MAVMSYLEKKKKEEEEADVLQALLQAPSNFDGKSLFLY